MFLSRKAISMWNNINRCIILLRRKAPSFREKVIVLREQLLHAIEITSEKILPTYLCHPGKMIDSLKSLHVLGTLYADAQIGPIKIPAAVLRNFSHPESGSHSSNHVVFAVCRADC